MEAMRNERFRDIVGRPEFGRVLDYAEGKGRLGAAMKAAWPEKLVAGWDPGWQVDHGEMTNPSDAIGSECWPGWADLIICLDMLEHVEPGVGGNGLRYVENVLEDIRRCLRPGGPRKVLFGVATTPAIAMLPAFGSLPERNAHLTVEPWGWWWEEMSRAGFSLVGSEGDFLVPGRGSFLALLTGAPDGS